MKKLLYTAVILSSLFTFSRASTVEAITCDGGNVPTADGTGCEDPNFNPTPTPSTPLPSANDGAGVIDVSSGSLPTPPIPPATIPPVTTQTNTATQNQTTGTDATPQTPIVTSNGNLTYVPLEPLPGLPQEGATNISAILNAVLRILVIVGAFLAVGAIVFAGVQYMVTDVVHTKFNAKKRAQNALWGLGLLLGAYIILNTINPQLLSFSNLFNPVGALPNYNVPGASVVNPSATPAPATALQSQQDACASGNRVFNASTGTCN